MRCQASPHFAPATRIVALADRSAGKGHARGDGATPVGEKNVETPAPSGNEPPVPPPASTLRYTAIAMAPARGPSGGVDMGALSWKIKRWFRQLLPIALAGAVVWGAYQMFFTRSGLRGPKTAVTRLLRNVPFFGSRFRAKPSYRHARKHRSYRHGRARRSYRKYHAPRRGKHHARSGKRRGRRR